MKFAFELEDGTVAIAIAAPKQTLERVMGPLADKDYQDFIRARLIPDAAKNVIELPDDWERPDWSRRSEWCIRDGKIVIG